MTETQLQIAVFEWAKQNYTKAPELALMYHIPNEGLRNKKTAAIMKKKGLKAGVPDLCLPVPRSGYTSLYIELKEPNYGKVSTAQSKYIKALIEVGCAVAVIDNLDECKRLISQYITGNL
jgi:hypothetical protein